MLTGPGLRTPRANSSEKLESPLMEDDLPVSEASFATDNSAMMPPAQAMEEPQVSKKPAAQKKKVQKNGKSAAAPKKKDELYLPATISLGDELLPEDFPRRDSGAGYENVSGAEMNESAAAAEQNSSEDLIDKDARRLIAKSWQELKEHEERTKKGQKANQAEADNDASGSAEVSQAEAKKSSGFWSFGRKKQEGESATSSKEKGNAKTTNANNNSWDIPQTFKEMCFLNAAMTGANMKYIETVESCFEKVVQATSEGDFVRLEIESSIMALRMYKDVQGKPNLVEFKTCMLASLRSLLPKSWSISHEQAWSKMWQVVQDVLTKTLPLPVKYEKAVEKALNNMSEEDKKTYGLNAFNRFFAKQKKAEDHFNTSNARLSVLAMQGLNLCQDIYREPTRLVNVVTSLGLKHIMYNISTDYFDSFVEACVEELACWTKDPAAVEGVEWALTQIAAIMIYTIREGSNPLLSAVITNNAKQIRKALAPLAKKDRAATCLGAQGQMLTKVDDDTRE